MRKTTNQPKTAAAAAIRNTKNEQSTAEGRNKTRRRDKTNARPANAISEISRARRQGSKIDVVVGILRAKSGATIDDLIKATGWQAHSVRGAISGTLKKKLGLKIASERADGVRRYRIAK